MAKSTNRSEIPPTELIKSKLEFEQELQARIKLGELILSGPGNKLIADYEEWTDYNDEYLKHAFNNEKNEYRKSYDDAGFSIMGPLSNYEYGTLEETRDTLNSKLDLLKKLIGKAHLLRSSIKSTDIGEKTIDIQIRKNEVFIVHGHDDLAKITTAHFIEKLGFKPIILHEQASSGRTIIEKIEEYSNVGFGIVLYTPCDLGGKTVDVLKSRARQNVVFEHGYLIGKIGRSNVCALVKGDIETPNDISGVVYVKMDDAGAWKMQIAIELKSSGYDVDLNLVIK